MKGFVRQVEGWFGNSVLLCMVINAPMHVHFSRHSSNNRW